MRVIMDYMYKDHLKAKPFRLLPFTSIPEPSAVLYLSYAFYYLYPACIQRLQQQPTTKKNKKETEKGEKMNCFSSLDKRLLLHFFNF